MYMVYKDTIDITPAHESCEADTLDADSQDAGSTDYNSPYSLRNLKLPPYFTNTMKNQKNKENKIDDKYTFDTPPTPDSPGPDNPNASAQDADSTDSYLPYAFRNRNKYYKITPNTKKPT